MRGSAVLYDSQAGQYPRAAGPEAGATPAFLISLHIHSTLKALETKCDASIPVLFYN